MKFTSTYPALFACLLLTGCTGLGLNSETELAFYEPDPFLTDGGLTGENYPAEPMASGPVGHARIMDANLSDTPNAQYPEVVEVAMPLIPSGTNTIKPASASALVPDNVLTDDSTNRPEIVAASHTDEIEFGDDPFAAQVQQGRKPVAVAAVTPIPTAVSLQDFSDPVRPSTVTESVSIPVNDSPGTTTRTVSKPAELQATPPVAEASTSGWRATR